MTHSKTGQRGARRDADETYERCGPVWSVAILSKAPKRFGARFPDVPQDAPGAEILREAGPKPESDEEREARERREERQVEQNRRFAEATRDLVPSGM